MTYKSTMKKSRRKTFFFIVTSMALLLGAIFFASWISLMGGFSRLEQRFVERNISRSQEVIQDRLDSLASKLSDWGTWDDTYAFIENKNATYIKSNLTSLALDLLKIDVMAFLNTRGDLVYVVSRSPDNGAKHLLPQGLKQLLVPGSLFLTHVNEKSSVTGISILSGAPVMVASAPIMQSDGKGPIRGSVVFASYLDAAELRKLGKIIRVDLAVQKMETVPLPPEFAAAREAFSKGKETFVKAFDAETIAGFSFLRNVSGKSILMLKVTMPREVTQFGRQTMAYFLWALIIVGLLFGGAVFLPLEKELTGRVLAEEAMGREQSLNKAIIDSIPGAFYVLDENGRYVRWNSYQRDEIVGKPEDQVAGTNAAETIHPDDRELILSRITNVVGSGTEEIVAGRVLLRGGPAFRWLLMTGRKLMIEGKAFLVGIGIDITEHKRVEEALMLQRTFSSVVLENIEAGVVACNEKGEMLLFNRVARDWHGMDPLSIPQAEWASHYNLYMEDGVTPMDINTVPLLRAFRGEKIRDIVMVIAAKSQRKRTVLTHAGPVEGGDGRILGAVAVMQDITELKQSEVILRESRAHLELALKSAKMGTWFFDRTQDQHYFDNATCRLLGIDPATFTGKSEDFLKAIHPDDRDMVHAALVRTFEKKSPYEVDYRVVWPDGSLHHVTSRGQTALDANGQAVRLNGLLWETTEFKQSEEEAEKRLRELEIFHAASMDREARIIELKKEIERLKAEKGPA